MRNQITDAIIRSLSVHEAGHALVISSLGAKVHSIAAFDPVAGGGVCRHDPIGNRPWETELDNCIRGAMAAMSGEIAEQMIAPRSSMVRRKYRRTAAAMMDAVLFHKYGLYGTGEGAKGQDQDRHDFNVMALSSGLPPAKFVQLCLERLVPLIESGRAEILGLAKRLAADALAQLRAAEPFELPDETPPSADVRTDGCFDPKQSFLSSATAGPGRMAHLRSSAAFSDASIEVDADAGIIRNAAVMTAGPAEGHGFEIDSITLQQSLALLKAKPDGAPMRFKHPDAEDDGEQIVIDDALGTQVGRLKNPRLAGSSVRGDIYLEDYAEFLPGLGNVKKYLLALAATDPTALGLSAVIFYDLQPLTDAYGATDALPAARVNRLDFVDFVGKAAANPNGLLSAGRGFSRPATQHVRRDFRSILASGLASAMDRAGAGLQLD
ncbi:MAG: hypothetical protein ABSH08_09650 [Tepidisphaeraceae bacterium]|jgi:hypothetical protein